MSNHGGARQGAGRKARSDEDALIEQLDKVIDKEQVINILHGLVNSGDMKALTLYMNYRYGKPKETKDIKMEIDKNFPDWLDES